MAYARSKGAGSGKSELEQIVEVEGSRELLTHLKFASLRTCHVDYCAHYADPQHAFRGSSSAIA